MTKHRSYLQTSAVALALALGLSACGGGSGGGSRPSPTPAPAPAPAPSPTPSPAPAPAPSTANADLVALSLSENFTNDAAVGTGRFPLDGSASTLTAGIAEFEIEYDAGADSYTVRGDGFTQGFSPDDLRSDDGSARIYERVSGNRSEALLLTDAGTSGELTQYVGGGLYLNALTTTSAVEATAAAFTYGVETPDGSVPVSGGANYGVALVGTNGQWSYAGLGTMAVDFMIGDFRITLDVQEIDPEGTIFDGFYPFRAEGALTGPNAFSGDFTLDTYERYRGTLNGRFYGPEAQEVGAAFAGNGHSDTAIVGFLIGRIAPIATGPNLSVANLWADQDYHLDASASEYYETVDGTGVLRNSPDSGGGLALSVDAATGDLTLIDSGTWRYVFSAGSGTVSADGRYLEYDLGDERFVRLYRAGSDNSELALTYASFAVVDEVRYRDVDLGTYRMRTYVPFGTPTLLRPASGAATYHGIVAATGTSQQHVYDLDGSANFAVDFGSDALTGGIDLSGTERYSGALVTIAPITFNGSIDWEGSYFSAEARTDWSDMVEGYLFGNFYGPGAEELMAVMQGVIAKDPLASDLPLDVSGVIVAKKD